MTRRRIAAVLVVLVAVGLAFPLSNLVIGLPEAVKLGSGAQGPSEFQAVTDALSRKCANCHTQEPNLPFYAGFPIARGMITSDTQKGLRYLDLATEFAKTPEQPMNEATLAKIEHSLVNGSMPPQKYLLLHWNGGLTGDELNAVTSWIKQERSEHYASANSRGDLRETVLQPLPPVPDLDPAKIAVGEKLFFDTRLSKDDTISCASCHGLDKGGTDQERFSTGVGKAMGDINSPTVFNAGLQIAQFWDGRAANLQEQAAGPVNNPIEMASSWPEVIGKLEQDATLKAEFEAAYPTGFSADNITHAIATFEETLITGNSAFDRFLLGDADAMSQEAKAGHALFEENACATCHVGMALGGQSFERMGREGNYFVDRGDPGKADNGRFNVTGKEADRHKFKVPMLRNIAVTAPYFHDGTVTSLEEAVRLMARHQLGRELSEDDIRKIAAFLRTLTGEYRGQPLS